MRARTARFITLVLLALSTLARAQEKPEDVKIVTPVVDKAAATVTLSGAFWNEHVAEWVEVSFCGRPSDFLHETLVSSTTTRTLLEKALRDIGCRDGDAWSDGIKDFARLRGDQFIVLVTFEQDGKKQTYSLDELLAFSGWGVALGPYGFMFKGDPDHAAATSAPAAPGVTAPGTSADGFQILHDDPQIALVFKGLQNRSQSFADHPLAYVEDRWQWEEIDRARNLALLPAAVFDSNGKIPVTLTFRKVTQEELLTQSIAVWHDDAFKTYMGAQMAIAKRIDGNKAQYLKLRVAMPAADRAKNTAAAGGGGGDLALLAAQIESDYAALDAAWTQWDVDHLKPPADASAAAAVRDQAQRWGEFMALNQERAAQLALAQQAGRDLTALDAQTTDPAIVARRKALEGQSVEANSRALIAENKQSRDYWQKQWDRINDPKANDVWAQSVSLNLALTDARLKAGAAGVSYGTALQQNPADAAQIAALKSALEQAARAMNLADAKLDLANVEFEISKRADTPTDPDLPNLKKQHDALTAKIKDLSQP